MQKVINLIKDLPETERPRERLERVGASNLTTEELIAIILKTGTKEMSAKVLATNVLANIKKISDLTNISINTLTSIKGVGKTKAIELLAAIELGKRVYSYNDINNISFTDAVSIYNYYRLKLFNSISYIEKKI